MMYRHLVMFCVASLGLTLGLVDASAQTVHVVDSTPTANAMIDGRTSSFSVRFDRPVDHVRSMLIVKRDDKVVETLQPRLDSAPEVLFARAPTLPPGKYTLHWRVITLTDVQTSEGDIPFRVAQTN
jgi:methionine-rich copper-binding protein CopC